MSISHYLRYLEIASEQCQTPLQTQLLHVDRFQSCFPFFHRDCRHNAHCLSVHQCVCAVLSTVAGTVIATITYKEVYTMLIESVSINVYVQY